MSTATLPLPATTRTLPSAFGIYLRETRYEFRRLLRTKTYSLAVIGFPVMFYTLFGLLLNRGEHINGLGVSRYLMGGYAVFGAVGAALFGIGVGLAAELHAGWLELKRASPMPPLAYLLAKCTTAVAFGVLIVCILMTMGTTLGNVHLSLADAARILGLAAVGVIPFACAGLLLAMLVPANAAPGITNMIYLPMSFLGGLWLPVDLLPKWLQMLAPALPTYHLGQLMFQTLRFPAHGTALGHTLYLVVFSFVMLTAAGIVFRRREANS
jgi:ABC-2 type transport system permease protein